VAGELVLRQVDAALRVVDPDVLPEVGELQPGADGIARGAVRIVVAPVQREQQAPDRVRGTARVVAQRRERRIAVHGHVLRERGQEIGERGGRQRRRPAREG